MNTHLISTELHTPLGTMLAIADSTALYFLGFTERKSLQNDIASLCKITQTTIISGSCMPLESIKQELECYFKGTLQEFTTPLHIIGTEFQKKCWNALCNIPYGQTTNYAAQASAINNILAQRAVGTANGNNRFSIIIPCHRIINSNGKLGGYNGGLNRKQWLLDFEKQNS